MGRENEQEAPRWCALKVRIDCPECGSALFVDGPYKKVLCSACGARTSVTALWRILIERAVDERDVGRSFRSSSFVWAGNEVPHILYAASKGQPPICTSCDEVLDEAESIPDGTSGDFFCPSCGSRHPTWPAPGYLKQARLRHGRKAQQVFMAPPEDAQGRPAPTDADAKPVIFGCPNCGANLRITGDSPRVLTCEHCDADAYLPPEVWNRLHPVRKRRAFWVRLG